MVIIKKSFSEYLFLILILFLFESVFSEHNVITVKKGIAAARFGPAILAKADAYWYYNWRVSPNSGTVPAGTVAPEFVPMISKASDVTDANINNLKNAKNNGTYKYLLGFNEPDISSQANMTVDQVISLWPRLMETGLILGSPAPSWTGTWIDNFMTQAKAKNLRVDFLCLHFYRSPSATNVISELKNFLTNAYNKYQLPIWLTEFGAPDCSKLGWCGSAPPLTQEITNSYVTQVISMLEDLPFVQRYAWFVDASQSGFEFSAIFNSSGELTQTGIVFRDAKGSSSVYTINNQQQNIFQNVFYKTQDGRIAISLPLKEQYNISIYNAQGKIVYYRSGLELYSKYDIFQKAKGIYIGKIIFSGKERSQKIVIW